MELESTNVSAAAGGWRFQSGIHATILCAESCTAELSTAPQSDLASASARPTTPDSAAAASIATTAPHAATTPRSALSVDTCPAESSVRSTGSHAEYGKWTIGQYDKSGCRNEETDSQIATLLPKGARQRPESEFGLHTFAENGFSARKGSTRTRESDQAVVSISSYQASLVENGLYAPIDFECSGFRHL